MKWGSTYYVFKLPALFKAFNIFPALLKTFFSFHKIYLDLVDFFDGEQENGYII